MAQLNLCVTNKTDYETPELLKIACVVAKQKFTQLQRECELDGDLDGTVHYYNLRETYENIIEAIERSFTK